MKERVGAIIIKDGALLLVTGFDSGTYWTPGGGKDTGETDEDTLRRELREELSVEIERFEPYCSYVVRSHRTGENVLCSYYRVTLAGDPTPSEEISACQWFDRASLERGEPSTVPNVRDHLPPRLLVDTIL